MKAFRFIALTIFSGTAVAQSVEDGLYELSDKETERAVVSIDGASHWLGKRFEITLDEKLVVSLDNDNERFQLTLRYRSDSIENISVARLLESGEASAQFPRLVLVIDDTRYVNSGSSIGSGQEAAFFYIAGAENAERVAAFFGTEVRYRYKRFGFSPR